jgi:hypothetical protein
VTRDHERAAGPRRAGVAGRVRSAGRAGPGASRTRRVLTVIGIVLAGTAVAVTIALSGLLSSDGRPLPRCQPRPGPDRAAPGDLPYSFPVPCTRAR